VESGNLDDPESIMGETSKLKTTFREFGSFPGRNGPSLDRDDKNGRNYDVAKGNVNRCTGGVFGFLGEGKFLILG
jgi:hypothetical protein